MAASLRDEKWVEKKVAKAVKWVLQKAAKLFAMTVLWWLKGWLTCSNIGCDDGWRLTTDLTDAWAEGCFEGWSLGSLECWQQVVMNSTLYCKIIDTVHIRRIPTIISWRVVSFAKQGRHDFCRNNSSTCGLLRPEFVSSFTLIHQNVLKKGIKISSLLKKRCTSYPPSYCQYASSWAKRL